MEKVFTTANRDESHRVLEYVNGSYVNLDRLDANGVDKDFPGAEKFIRTPPDKRAECQEDDGALEYTVWVNS